MGTLLGLLFGFGVAMLFVDPPFGVGLLTVWGILFLGYLPFLVMKDAERK